MIGKKYSHVLYRMAALKLEKVKEKEYAGVLF